MVQPTNQPTTTNSSHLGLSLLHAAILGTKLRHPNVVSTLKWMVRKTKQSSDRSSFDSAYARPSPWVKPKDRNPSCIRPGSGSMISEEVEVVTSGQAM